MKNKQTCTKRRICSYKGICCISCKVILFCPKSCFYHRRTKKVDITECKYLRPVPPKLIEKKKEKEQLKQLEREKEKKRRQLQKQCEEYNCEKCPLPDPYTCTRQRTFVIHCYNRRDTTLIDCHRFNKANNGIRRQVLNETQDEMFNYWTTKITVEGRTGGFVVQSIDRFGKHNCYSVSISNEKHPFPCEFGRCTQPFDIWSKLVRISEEQRKGWYLKDEDLEEFK